MNKQVKVETIETAEGLRVSVFSGVAFVQPQAAGLDDDQAADLERARELMELGASAAAAAILGHLERELGVTQEEHIVGVLAAEAHLAAERRRAQIAVRQAEHGRAELLMQAMAMPAPTDAVRYSLEKAEEARAEAATLREAKNYRAMKDQLAAVRRHHDRAANLRRAQLDLAWAAQVEGETVALAAGRGEFVGWGSDATTREAMRIKSRDGLENLFESGSLTRLQRDWGRFYRARFELQAAGLKVQTMEPSTAVRAPADPTRPRSAAEMQKARLLLDLKVMENAVRIGKRGERRLTLLRAVAGEGHCIRDIVKGGGARTRATDALAAALDMGAAAITLANRGR